MVRAGTGFGAPMGQAVMKRLLGAAALGTTALGATSAWAQAEARSDEGRFSIGVTAGTTGVGPRLGYRLNEVFGVRAEASFLGLDHSFTSGGINYDGHASLRSGGVILDIHPFGGGFRLSAGARINGNKGRVRAVPNGPTKIGDLVFTPDQIGTITGRADVRDFAPQVTIGYGGRLTKGLNFTIDAGALFQGPVRIRDFTSTGTLATDPTIAGSTYRNELAKQRQKLQDTANNYQVYPVLELGLQYRF